MSINDSLLPRACNPILAPASTHCSPQSLHAAARYTGMGMPQHLQGAHPPRARRQQGDLEIPMARSFGLSSPLLLPKAVTRPACSTCACRGDGSHHRRSQRCLGAGPRFPLAEPLFTPLPSCHLGFELLLRLKFPMSSCLHPSAGGFASS